ncbi:hypothetical protein C6502_19050 [Candidatus Poribacteria bacterium]|nr:MAG: hypothetical protein C6502_19050 [Candidatus Poribacteria bacterium]
MKIGLFYEPAYWFLLEDLVRDLEYEIRLIGGQSYRLTTETLDQTDVDLVYVLPCDEQETLKQIEAKRLVINSMGAQEIAIDKIATSRLMVENNMPTPETVISQTPDAVVKMLDRYGIALLKSTNLCGGAGHRILRREGSVITTRRHDQTYQIAFGERNCLLDQTLVLAPPYYVQQFIGGTAQTNDRVYRMYVAGDRVVMGTMRVKEGVDTAEKSIINVATGAHYEFLQTLDAEMVSLALRLADLIGFELGVVDFLRDSSGRPLIIEADCDGCHLFICRKFQETHGYGTSHNFNAHLVKRLAEIVGGASHRR